MGIEYFGGPRTLNGLAVETQTFEVASSGTDFGIASSGTAHTFSIPNASATARGLVTTGTQTIAGNKTFSGTTTLSPNFTGTTTGNLNWGSSAYIGASAGNLAFHNGTGPIRFQWSGGFTYYAFNQGFADLTNGGGFRWCTQTFNPTTVMTVVTSTSTGTVELRNGGNPHSLQVYSTYSSATSFECLQIRAVSGGSYRIGSAVGSAGGTARQMDFGRWNAAGTWGSLLTWDANDFLSIPTTVRIGYGSGFNSADLKIGNTEIEQLGDGSGFAMGSNGYGFALPASTDSSSCVITRAGIGNSGRTLSLWGAIHTTVASTSWYDWRAGAAGSNATATLMRLGFNGSFQLIQPVSTTGSPTQLLITGGAHTTLTASTEATDVNFNLARTVQFANGAITTQRAFRIQAPVYSHVSGSNTITTASTVSISGPPTTTGGFTTITNAYALNVESGANKLGDFVKIGTGNLAATLGTTTISATTSLNAGFVSAVDSSGRAVLEVTGVNTGSGFGGAYFTANGHQEAWFNVISTLNTSGSRVMRFGNLAGRFSVQLLNDAVSAITSTPFSIANVSPSNSFYMHASGGVSLGGINDPGAGGLFVTGAISGTSNTLEQRNSTNAQTFSVYRTFTSGTSYEALRIKGNSGGPFIIATDVGSAGGTVRGIQFGNYTAADAVNLNTWFEYFTSGSWVVYGGFNVNQRYGDNATACTTIHRKARGTASSPTGVLSGDTLGIVSGGGYRATSFSGSQAYMSFTATEDYTDTATGTRLAFFTTPNASTTATSRFHISQDGNVCIGTNTAPATKLVIEASNTGATENNTLRFVDTDTTTQANQVIGKIEFWSSDATAPGAGVKGYISCVSESDTPAGCLIFATDAVSGTPTQHMKLGSTGLLTLEGGVKTTKTIYQTAEVTNTPTGTTQTITLNNANHQTLLLTSATGAVTVTLTVPSGPSAGTIIVTQHATTTRDLTWTVSSGSIRWLGTEPDWAADAATKERIVAWRFNGTNMYLSATDSN